MHEQYKLEDSPLKAAVNSAWRKRCTTKAPKSATQPGPNVSHPLNTRENSPERAPTESSIVPTPSPAVHVDGDNEVLNKNWEDEDDASDNNGESSGKMPQRFRDSVVQTLYDALPTSERNALRSRAKEAIDKQREAYKAALNGPASTDPETIAT